jgi:thymidylate kinase
MEQKVFVLGLPGSGKSTVARYIDMLARDSGWKTSRFNDYYILLEMFRADQEGKRFSPTEYGGFDIHKHDAFDEGLKELERVVLKRKEAPDDKNELIIIEFARDDYCRALNLLSPELLQDAFFLFLDTDIDTCKQRIHDRVANPQTEDDHDVSVYIFESYYQNDKRQYLTSLTSNLKGCCDINRDRVWVIDNPPTKSIQQLLENVEALLTPILEQRIPYPETTAVSDLAKDRK